MDQALNIDHTFYKLNKSNFSAKYAFDDTSDALITHTYHQRNIGLVTASRKNLLIKVQDYKELRHLSTSSDRKIVKETILKKSFKLSRKSFLKKYGTDDSLTALINVFFNDRLIGWIALPTYPVLILTPGIFSNYSDIQYYMSTGDISPDGKQGVFFGDYYATGIGAMIISASGGYLLMVNSRKRLYNAILYYQTNHCLPPKYRERIANKIERAKTDILYRNYKKKQKAEEYKKLMQDAPTK